MALGKRVVLASGNAGKLLELRQLLSGLDVQIVPQSELWINGVEETGLSFVENAIIKARNAARGTGLPAIADDSGLEVDVLGGEPGIRSARYAGKGAGDAANLRLLLERVAATGVDRPAARFQCAMAFMRYAADPMPAISQGTWEGWIVPEPRGDRGFGYDPVFFVPEYGCTSAELAPQIKNRISHRALAMRDLRVKLDEWADGRERSTHTGGR